VPAVWRVADRERVHRSGGGVEYIRSANPASIPFYLPNRFQLDINLKKAKAMNLEIPQVVLASADEVIE
jgi:ABC-type uncharacterized transport system substrate-binding protein